MLKKIFSWCTCIIILAVTSISFVGCVKEDISISIIKSEIVENGEMGILCGGWSYNDMPVCTLPDEVQKAFDKATSGSDDVKYTPVLYVGSQIVAGTNYCIVCKKEEKDAFAGCVTMIIYADLQGDAEITSTNNIIQ